MFGERIKIGMDDFWLRRKQKFYSKVVVGFTEEGVLIEHYKKLKMMAKRIHTTYWFWKFYISFRSGDQAAFLQRTVGVHKKRETTAEGKRVIERLHIERVLNTPY